MSKKNFAIEQSLLNDPKLNNVLLDLFQLPDQNTEIRLRFLVFLYNSYWIEVEHDKDGNVQIWKRSHEEHHNLRDGPAICITISQDGCLTMLMETSLSLWITWDRSRGDETDLRRAIEFAKFVHLHLVK